MAPRLVGFIDDKSNNWVCFQQNNELYWITQRHGQAVVDRKLSLTLGHPPCSIFSQLPLVLLVSSSDSLFQMTILQVSCVRRIGAVLTEKRNTGTSPMGFRDCLRFLRVEMCSQMLPKG